MSRAVVGAGRRRRTGLWATARRLSIGAGGQAGGQAREAAAVHGAVHGPPARRAVHSPQPRGLDHLDRGDAVVAPGSDSDPHPARRPARISGRFPPEFLDTTAKSLDEQVETFRNRPLEKAYHYVWLDAMYVKVRLDGRVRSRAVFVAIGVNEDGEREVLAVDIARKEMESSWREFLRYVVDVRKLHGVRCVMSDAHEGLRKAIPAVFNDVTWQRCYVHFMRNVLDKVSKTAQPLVKGALQNIFHQTSREAASEALNKAISLLQEKHPAAAELLIDAEDEVLAYYAFPQDHWKKIRSTNPLERLNKELRRRVRVVGLFPDEASVIRLLGSILVEQDDEWRVADRRYLSAGSMAQLALLDGKEAAMITAAA